MGFIYIIINKITNAAYIGSTLTTIENRYKRHIKDLKWQVHHSIFLQRAWNKYGEGSFDLKMLEEVKIDSDLLVREQFYLDERKRNYPPDKNYNVCWIAGNCQGRVLSEETKKKISVAQTGRKNSLASKLKCSNTHALRHGKRYLLVSPDGVEYETNNLRRFGREHRLNNLSALTRGEISHHKGWTLKNNPRKTFKFLAPDGMIFDNILCLKEFCSTNKLPYKSMNKLYHGGLKNCRGWRKV